MNINKRTTARIAEAREVAQACAPNNQDAFVIDFLARYAILLEDTLRNVYDHQLYEIAMIRSEAYNHSNELLRAQSSEDPTRSAYLKFLGAKYKRKIERGETINLDELAFELDSARDKEKENSDDQS